MNREIKFRAWYIKAKIFKYPKLWDNTMPSNWEQHYILQQFTGLKDKNGKEIYEGDIIRKSWTGSTKIKKHDEEEWRQYDDLIVEFKNYQWSFMEQVDFDGLTWINDNAESIEIIGNIYQNPELVK